VNKDIRFSANIDCGLGYKQKPSCLLTEWSLSWLSYGRGWLSWAEYCLVHLSRIGRYERSS